jgi:hypothetical protein
LEKTLFDFSVNDFYALALCIVVISEVVGLFPGRPSPVGDLDPPTEMILAADDDTLPGI